MMIFVLCTMVYALTMKQILQSIFILIVFKSLIVIKISINNNIYFLNSDYSLEYEINID